MKWLIWIALPLAACGKSSDGKAGSNAASSAKPSAGTPGEAVVAGPQDRCEVHVTGSQTVDMIGTKRRSAQDPNVSAGTEYWLTEDELRRALTMMTRIGGDKQDVERKVDEAMKKDPRLWLLLINCKTDDGFLHLGASNSSKSRDIPFGPHSYVISSDPKAGEFATMFSLEKAKALFHLTAPGTLDITKFDATGLTGTFRFEAETRDKSQHVAVAGSFDFGCQGQKCK